MVYVFINIILIVLAIYLIKFWNPKNKANKLLIKIEQFVDKNYKLMVVILFFLMLFTSLYKFGIVPAGMHVDEAGMAYDAWSLSSYGVDRYLNKWPVYLINYGGGQSALYAYLAALFIKIFGYSITVIRMPAVIIRVFAFISSYFLIKNENNKAKSLLLLFLLAVCPYFILQSRWGLDCNLLVGLLTISVCFFVNAIIKNNNILLFLSGLFFGFSLYAYALSYIIIPLLLLFNCIYLLYLKKLNLKKLIIFGFPIFLLALPLMLMILVNNGFIDQINSFITIPLLPNYRGVEISLVHIVINIFIIPTILFFDCFFEFGGDLIYNSIPYFGTLYYFSIPFLILGIRECIKNIKISISNKQFDLSCIISFWGASVLICMLIIREPNINKANAIFLPLVYFVTLGIMNIVKKHKQLLIMIVAIYLINFGLFGYYYFNHYNIDYNQQTYFVTSYLDAVDYGRSLEKSNIYIEKRLIVQEHIYILLDNFVSPYDYHGNEQVTTVYNNKEIIYTFSVPESIDDNAVYILSTTSDLSKQLKSLDFSEKVFDNISVFTK